MLPLRLFKSSFITSRHFKARFNMARIHGRTLASRVAADRLRLLAVPKVGTASYRHINCRFSIHVPLDVYKSSDFLYITSAVSE